MRKVGWRVQGAGVVGRGMGNGGFMRRWLQSAGRGGGWVGGGFGNGMEGGEWWGWGWWFGYGPPTLFCCGYEKAILRGVGGWLLGCAVGVVAQFFLLLVR